MNKFRLYIINLFLIFIGMTSILVNWTIPKFIQSTSNKAIILLFLGSLILLSFHFFHSLFKKYKTLNSFRNEFKVKLVKNVMCDNPRQMEKMISFPFLPPSKLRIQDGTVTEFYGLLKYDPSCDYFTAEVCDDNRFYDDGISISTILEEYKSRGWKIAK